MLPWLPGEKCPSASGGRVHRGTSTSPLAVNPSHPPPAHPALACQAAAHEFNSKTQRDLLKASAYGKCFCDYYNADGFVENCKTLRVINNLRHPEVPPSPVVLAPAPPPQPMLRCHVKMASAATSAARAPRPHPL